MAPDPKRARVAVIEILDDVSPRREEAGLPKEFKEVLLRDPSAGMGRLKTLQLHVASFLTIRDVSSMRMVDQARSTLPLTSDDVDASVCRGVLRRVRRLRVEFYVDELDGIMTLMTDNMDAFTNLSPSSQTPGNLIATLQTAGIVFFPTPGHNACWIKTSSFHETYELLSETQTRKDLLRGCRMDADGVETVVVKVAGAIPAFFTPRIHNKETELLVEEGISDGAYTQRQHDMIDAAIAYHNDAFDADRRLRQDPSFTTTAGMRTSESRVWTPAFMDPEHANGRIASVDKTVFNEHGVPFLLRYDFRDGEELELVLTLE